ncbi:hypothetical protein CEY02_05720, partial [Bacillus pumilus]
PSHSVSVLRAGAHECQIRSAPVLVLPRLQRFSITLKRRQRAKITFILALCQQSVVLSCEDGFFDEKTKKKLSSSGNCQYLMICDKIMIRY